MADALTNTPMTDAFLKGHEAHGSSGPAARRADWARCFDDVLSGRNLARTTADLVEKFVDGGMSDAAVLDAINALFEGSTASPDGRGQCLDELPLVLETAREKWKAKQRARPLPATRTSFFDPWEAYIVPSFPLDVLPAGVRDFVESHAKIVGCDVSALAMATLGNFSAALDHRFALKMLRHGDWFAHPRLWILFVGPPSFKKTPLMKAATSELLAIHGARLAAYKRDLAAYEQAKEAGDELAIKPIQPARLVAMDITYEKMAEVLSQQERAGCLVKRDEIAGWLGAMEKYSSGRGAMADRGFWLTAYDVEPYDSGRIGRGEFYIPLLSTSVMGGIQPARLAEVHGLTSDGLLQRFLPVMMARGSFREDVKTHDDFSYYAKLTRRLIDAEPVEFILDDEALAAMDELHLRLHDIEGVSGGLADGFEGFVGKLPGILGSLALILHMISTPEATFASSVARPVVVESIENAGRIVLDFVLPHAFEFYRTAETVTGGDRIQRMASYILTSGKTRFVASDFTTNVRLMRNSTSADLAKQVSTLVAGGWLVEGPALNVWTLNPAVPAFFAQRAADEERRKAELAHIMHSPRQSKGA